MDVLSFSYERMGIFRRLRGLGGGEGREIDLPENVHR